MAELTYMEKINQAAEAIERAVGKADIAIVLGSGLGDYAEQLTDAKSIDYKDIPNFPVSTVQGHKGRWHTGLLHGKRVCMMQGRFHAYEGYDMQDVTLPVRVMQKLGVQTLVVTNAAGGVNLAFQAGDLMLITDILNLTGRNPLIGPNLDAFGPRFPDMTRALDRDLQQLALDTATKLNIPLQQGIYCWLNGPTYETPAEIRMVRVLGADAVGMSTVPEIIVARHGGMRVLGISCITNMAAGVLDQPLNHEEVMAMGNKVKGTFQNLLDGIIRD
ncbi:MAG TPA: purine-nucleoside phosphorylase, partial [Candidatus Limiplasma sp.]|nr:purine-nucleoside phosphorylase [Candidatus Limiplasma sp.]